MVKSRMFHPKTNQLRDCGRDFFNVGAECSVGAGGAVLADGLAGEERVRLRLVIKASRFLK